MLLICGSQRSGTTILTRFLHELGHDVGSHISYDNTIQGGYESPHIIHFMSSQLQNQQSYLFNKNSTFPYQNYWDHIDMRQADLLTIPELLDQVEVQKASFLLMQPLFLHWYLTQENAIEKTTFVIPYRAPTNVCASKKKHSQFSKDHPALNLTAQTLAINMALSVQMLIMNYCNYIILPYPLFLLEAEIAYHALSPVIMTNTTKSEFFEVWNTIIDKTKISLE